MKIFLTLILIFNLTGCATAPRLLAEMFDSADPCQRRNYVNTPPRFCGASKGQEYFYDMNGRQLGYTKKN